MLNIKVGDQDPQGFVNVFVSEDPEGEREIASWGVLGSKAYESIQKHGYDLVQYLGNGSYKAERI